MNWIGLGEEARRAASVNRTASWCRSDCSESPVYKRFENTGNRSAWAKGLPYDDFMTRDIQMRHAVSQPIAVIRRRTDRQNLSRFVTESCGTVWNTLKTQGVAAGRNIAVYWDDGITTEAGVELLGPFAGSDSVRTSSTPSGLVVSTAFLGPYHRLGEAHSAIVQWCAESRRSLAGPRWEIYGHWREEWNSDPSKIRTDVFYLLNA